jgi:hypothetical protein
MSITQRTLVAAFVLVSSLLVQLAHAGPVQSQEATTASVIEPGLGSTTVAPTLPTAAPNWSPPRQDADTPALPGALSGGDAAANPSASALAADIIREAEAGAAAAATTPAPPGRKESATGEKPSGLQPAAGQQGSAQAQADDMIDEGELRQFGKAAANWLRDAVPFLRSDDDGEAAPKVEWSGSNSGGHSATVGLSAEAALAERRARAQILLQPDAPNPSDVPRQPSFQGEHNLVRDAVKAVQEVLTHPMAWLVIAIFVIGGVAMSLADRRPK